MMLENLGLSPYYLVLAIMAWVLWKWHPVYVFLCARISRYHWHPWQVAGPDFALVIMKVVGF